MGIRANIDADLHALTVKDTESYSYFLHRTRKLGFEFCATGVQLPFPLSAPTTHLENNYPRSWQHEYAQRGYLTIDPTIGRALATSRPILWSGTFKEAEAFWEDARGHGLGYGISVATRHRRGGLGMLSFARPADDITPGEAELIVPELIRLAEIFATTKVALTLEERMPESQATLTEREKEVLRWTADGKTSEEVGTILALSTSTVNFHINKVLEKLHAVNKTQAVVKAVLCQLL